MNLNIEQYKQNGFYIKRKLLSKNSYQEILSQLDNIHTDMKIPHTNIQFGYGNLIHHKLANIVTDHKYIKECLVFPF